MRDPDDLTDDEIEQIIDAREQWATDTITEIMERRHP